MPLVRPKYVALLAKRYCTEQLAVTSNHKEGKGLSNLPQRFIMDDVPILSIEIQDVAERRLVTLIEILSPVNKRGDGAREYAQRRLEIMHTSTHLLEIDLLCQGRRIQLLREPPRAPYYVYLSRTERRPYTQVWAIELQQPLPVVPVPLLTPDADVALDLQAAIKACFDLVGYEQLLDYLAEPPAGLLEEQRWATTVIRQWQATDPMTESLL